jgi:hypothetical protein
MASTEEERQANTRTAAERMLQSQVREHNRRSAPLPEPPGDGVYRFRGSTGPDRDVTPALGAALAEAGTRRYRRKPSEVDAIQWTGGNLPAVRAFASGALGPGTLNDGSLPLWVLKSRAVCHVERGDWILREPDGRGFYPCEQSVFAAAYELVEP